MRISSTLAEHIPSGLDRHRLALGDGDPMTFRDFRELGGEIGLRAMRSL